MTHVRIRRYLQTAPVLCGLFALAVSAVFTWRGEVEIIQNSTSSTAAIGYLFLPLGVLIFGLPWFFVGATAGWGYRAVVHRRARDALIFSLGLVLSVSYIAYEWAQYREEKELVALVAAIETMNSAQIDDFLTTSEYRHNRFALGAIAQNSATSSAALARIADLPLPELHRAMGAAPAIMGNNRKGLAVMRLVALHPNVTPEVLSMLSHSPVDYVLGTVAGNPLTPVADLERLFSETRGTRSFYLIAWGLASNAKTPLWIIEQLAQSDDEYTLRYLKNNPATPEHVRVTISI